MRITIIGDSGREYELSNSGGFLSCTCPDFQYRRLNDGHFCKHLVRYTTNLVNQSEKPLNRTQRLATLLLDLRAEESFIPSDVQSAYHKVVSWAAIQLANRTLGNVS